MDSTPYAEGQGWQDYIATHQLEPSSKRRVRFYPTSQASADERDIIQRAAEREFRLLQGIQHPGSHTPATSSTMSSDQR